MCRTFNNELAKPLVVPNFTKEKSNTLTNDEIMDDDVLAEFLEGIINSQDGDDSGMEFSMNDLNQIIDGDHVPDPFTDSNDSYDIQIIEEPQRRKTDLQKVCGFQTYQHVIRKAIESSPNGQMTLHQIYAWVDNNVEYFRNLSETGKDKSWKNSIRHNLSLHRQFYKVLCDGQRSCLWACDMDRIGKPFEKRVKTKVGQKSPKSFFGSTFRPRSKTDPYTIKLEKIPVIKSQSYDSLVISKKIYPSLSARFEAIEKAKNFFNFTQVPSTLVERIQVTFNHVFSDNFSKERLVNFKSSDMSETPNQPNILLNFLDGSNSGSSITLASTSSDDSSSESDQYQLLDLDEQAILDHERCIYELDFILR